MRFKTPYRLKIYPSSDPGCLLAVMSKRMGNLTMSSQQYITMRGICMTNMRPSTPWWQDPSWCVQTLCQDYYGLMLRFNMKGKNAS